MRRRTDKVVPDRNVCAKTYNLGFSRYHNAPSQRRPLRGFTLIELLVVIAIIALLLSILMPALRRVKDSATVMVCKSRLHQTGLAMKLYSDACRGLLPDDHSVSGSRDTHGYAVYKDSEMINGKPKPFRFAYLYEMKYIEVPEIFYCPSSLAVHKYEDYTDPAPWGTLPQRINTSGGSGNQWVRIGYTYYPVDKRPRLNSFGVPSELATKYTELNNNLPYVTDFLHGDSSQSALGYMNHQRNGNYWLNAMFPDGHVVCCNDAAVFKDPVWGKFAFGYDYCYYTIFKLIKP